MNAVLVLFLVLCGAGAAALALAPRPLALRLLAWLGGLAGASLIVAGSGFLLAEAAQSASLSAPFTASLRTLPGIGSLDFGVDGLTAWLLAATGLVVVAAAPAASVELERRGTGAAWRRFGVFYFVLIAAVAGVLLSRDALSFFLCWEIMSIGCFLLVDFDADRRQGAIPGYTLLAAGEVGALAAMGAFLLLAASGNGLDFASLRIGGLMASPGLRWAAFLLAFFGFGVKAGLVPGNFWLPRAYAAASPAFAPLLAGATLNLGLYGILRVGADLLPPASSGPGLIALGVGAATALVGILYATTETDLKALLAFSSAENAGIVTAGFGAGFVFAASAHPALAAMAYAAALYHLLNHACYKALLFIGAGAVEGATGERNLDRLGGVARFLPVASALFLVGVLGIAAFPPFNGFVSEWLTLQTLLRCADLPWTGVKLEFALCGAALALTSALAVTCFVRLYAMGFLGMCRLPSPPAGPVPERKPTVWGLAVLAAACLALGVLPTYVLPVLDRAVVPLAHASAADTLVPPFFAGAARGLPEGFRKEFHNLGAQVGQGVVPGRGLVVLHRGGEANPVVFAMSTAYTAAVLALILAVAYGVMRWAFGRRGVTRASVWDGGIRSLPPGLTYTATGFANPVKVIFEAIYRPTKIHRQETVNGLFRTTIQRRLEETYLFDRWVIQPACAAALGLSRLLGRIHHGKLNSYTAYVLGALIVVLIALL